MIRVFQRHYLGTAPQTKPLTQPRVSWWSRIKAFLAKVRAGWRCDFIWFATGDCPLNCRCSRCSDFRWRGAPPWVTWCPDCGAATEMECDCQRGDA